MTTKIINLFALIFLVFSCNSKKEADNTHNEEKVVATLETEQTQSVEGEDAADDPALWYNHSNPDKSLILGTNKRLGLEVYKLTGKRVASYNTGRLNNVDTRYNFKLGESVFDIAAASNRDYNRIDIWAIEETGTNFRLISDTSHKSGLSGVYGFCLYKNPKDSSFHAFVNSKDGVIEQWLLVSDSSRVKFELIKTFQAVGQVEGMVADDETGILYVGEEDGGIYEYDIHTENERKRIDQSGEENKDIKYDIEGLAMYYIAGGGGYLLASSQGNNRIAAFERQAGHTYLGYFEVKDGKIDGVKETDGIEVLNLSIGPDFPKGLFVCQDGFNTENGEDIPQNFKLVSWEKVAKSFESELKIDTTFVPFSLK